LRMKTNFGIESPVQELSRHQCLIYSGSPAQHLPALAALIRRKLDERHRCLYLDSPPIVAGMRSYLAAAGVDVARAVEKGSLVLSSDQGHLVDGHFDADVMLRGLEDAVQQALKDGYQGLCATGDMTWEFGSRKEMAKLLEYEWKLEDIFRRQPFLLRRLPVSRGHAARRGCAAGSPRSPVHLHQ
jgi:hypothetical protein